MIQLSGSEESPSELERTAAPVAVGHPVLVRGTAGHDDARGVADAVRAAGGCVARLAARAGQRGAPPPRGLLAVESQAALLAAGRQPAAVVGRRPGLRPRLPRPAFGAGQPGG